MHKLIVILENEDLSLIRQPNYECFLADSSLSDKVLANLSQTVKAQNKIFLISGDNACALCQKYNADGVLIDVSKSEHCVKEVNFARKQIGDKILGVISRNRRHEAMLISECEPDFVAFKVWEQGREQTKELVAWYTEMFLIQSAVIPQEKLNNIEQFDCDIVIQTVG